jgi:transposase
MEHYVGLDVSLKLTAICVVDQAGKIKHEGVVPSDPEAIATFISRHAPHVARIGLETGATSTWLWTELNNLGLPVICIDARHAKAVLKMQINKSDRNDAVGIASKRLSARVSCCSKAADLGMKREATRRRISQRII